MAFKEMFFKQYIDHFNFRKNDSYDVTYMQRYLIEGIWIIAQYFFFLEEMSFT